MAVKEALLSILTLGPAYGLQLHTELGERAPHRARTNVGQIYGTLERLTLAGFIQRFGHTADGLPLYSLTESGRVRAEEWLSGSDLRVANEWTELLDRVLIARSLNNAYLETIIGSYERILAMEPSRDSQRGRGQNTMLMAATARFEGAALGWLGDVRRDMSRRIAESPQATLENDVASQAAYGYALERPKRGRPTLPVQGK